MERSRQHHRKRTKITTFESQEEVSSREWQPIHMTDQEEDLIYRMYMLVGERWDLIAGRIPGRKAEEIERFWIMRHGRGFFPNELKKQCFRTSTLAHMK